MSDGGLSGVEALTLPRGDEGDDNDGGGGGGGGEYEFACNLLRPGEEVRKRFRSYLEGN